MKNKLVVIHQPDFMPYLGFFQRLITADIYIVLDNVQYVRGSRTQTSRDKIKALNGEKWINVGIQKPLYKSRIDEIYLLKDNSWKERSLNLIKENYRKADYFEEVYPYIENSIRLNVIRWLISIWLQLICLLSYLGLKI